MDTGEKSAGKEEKEGFEKPFSCQVSVGVAGWAYPDWEGYVYPPGMRDRERLRYIASFVDVVEINSTFYRPPDRRTALGWLQQTADLADFFFTAKIHQNVTHEGVIESEVVEAFHDGFAPLVKAQKLRHLLAQFRYDFSDSPEARNHLYAVIHAFGDITQITLELRHNSWQAPAALEYLSSLGVNVATLDYPTARNSFNLRVCMVGAHRYFRLHGRNARAWFDRQAGRDERYDYCYSEEEIEDIVKRATELARSSRTLTIVANNHFRGKEVVNALQIKAAISGRRVAVPPVLRQHYPQLEQVAI